MESLAKAFEDGDIISWNSSDSKPSSFEMVEQQSVARAAPLLALILAESTDETTIVATYPASLPEDLAAGPNGAGPHNQLLQICSSGAFTLITGKGDDVEDSRPRGASHSAAASAASAPAAAAKSDGGIQMSW